MELRKYGVGVENIVYGGPRLGIYFVEKGVSQRPVKVLYDRENSSMALSKRQDYDWDKILEDASWFHFTGITPALGGECAQICKDALEACRRKQITVSCDINYRKKLWSEDEAEKVMSELMEYIDVCFINEGQAKDVFKIHGAYETDPSDSGRLKNCADVAKKISEKFHCRIVASTIRTSISASINDWSGMLYKDNKVYYSPLYRIQIVDRVGGGDSFAGALIYALKSGYDDQTALDFATAASCLKQTIEYDFNLCSVEDVKSLMENQNMGYVQR